MNDQLKQLVDQIIELTGASPPHMLDDDAPVLRADDGSIYLIGLVGGKDVGKSSLINALVGRPISDATSFGPGTEKVIAYAHDSTAQELGELLEDAVPDRFSIITHRIDELRQQVLLDLPDIDSRYGDHLQVTRRMLRHMLYPLWIQSIEKYADLRPQELLAAVAEGNDPANFIFCLNKADQIGDSDAQELRKDFAQRVARVTALPSPARVFLLSATHPGEFDLPALREILSQQRPSKVVRHSRALAQRRQDRSLLAWVQRQRLPERAAQLEHLHRDAQEIIAARIAPLLLDQAVPRLLDDPGQRMAMLAPVLKLRLSRWPIINALDALLSPLLSLVQKNLSASAGGWEDPDAYLSPPNSVSSGVQAAFAQIHQLHANLAGIYKSERPWESIMAEQAAADLRQRFVETLRRQREAIAGRAGGRWPALLAPVRWLLTIGALLWFPLIQPVANVLVQEGAWPTSRALLRLLVQILSVAHLFQNAIFLLIWFLALWMLLRFSAQRKVARVLQRLRATDTDDEASLPGQCWRWMEQLLEPIERQRKCVQSLMQQADELQTQLKSGEPAPNPLVLAPALG